MDIGRLHIYAVSHLVEILDSGKGQCFLLVEVSCSSTITTHVDLIHAWDSLFLVVSINGLCLFFTSFQSLYLMLILDSFYMLNSYLH